MKNLAPLLFTTCALFLASCSLLSPPANSAGTKAPGTKAPGTKAPDGKLLFGFESDADLASAQLDHALAVRVSQGATEGNSALQLDFQSGYYYPSISYHPAAAWDWSGYGGLAMDLTNPGTDTLSLAVRVDDDAKADGRYHCRSAVIVLKPGVSVSALMPFNADPAAPPMPDVPGLTKMWDTGPGGFVPFNPGHIVALELFVVNPKVNKRVLVDNIRLIPTPPAPPLETTPKPLLSFENPAGMANLHLTDATAELTTDGVTDGKSALKVSFTSASSYPNVEFPLTPPQNFLGYGGLALDITNPGPDAVRFGVRLDDAPDDNGGHRQGGSTIAPGQTASFVYAFQPDPISLGMKSLPPINEMRSLGSMGDGPFDLGHIANYQVFLIQPTESQSLILDNVRLVPGAKLDLGGVIDAFGQNTKTDWPGKLKSAAEYPARIAAEEADIAAHPMIPGEDKYGGWAGGPQLKATGFFRTEKYQGKWSLVDPDGRLFFSVGADTVGIGEASVVTGREYMYGALPADDPILNKHKSHTKTIYAGPVKEGDTIDFYGANLERKYGTDYKAQWQASVLKRLPSWGLNTIGDFSDWCFNGASTVPYTVALWPAWNHARVDMGWGSFDDPFDPKFGADVNVALQGQLDRVKDDPYCLGYFVGNEEKWGNGTQGRSRYTIPLTVLATDVSKSPAKVAFLAQLHQKYGDIAALNTAWGTTFAIWDDLNAPFKATALPDAMQTDLSTFFLSFARQYFKTVHDTIKAGDPNHLYLGCRFAGYTPETLQASTEFTDVTSFNLYRLNIDRAEWDKILAGYDHPVLIGEFHFGALDRGQFGPGLLDAGTQKGRGEAFKKYVNSVLDNPMFVGCHWFQYTDEPLLGRTLDGENGNLGWVNVTDTPYPELVAAGREMAAGMYGRRYGK